MIDHTKQSYDFVSTKKHRGSATNADYHLADADKCDRLSFGGDLVIGQILEPTRSQYPMGRVRAAEFRPPTHADREGRLS